MDQTAREQACKTTKPKTVWRDPITNERHSTEAETPSS